MKKYLIVIPLVMLVAACSLTTQQKMDTSYKFLATSAGLYDTAMKIANELDKAGMLTPEEKRDIVSAGLAYYSAWHTARLAVEVWFVTQTDESADKALVAINTAVVKFTEFMDLVKPILARWGYTIE